MSALHILHLFVTLSYSSEVVAQQKYNVLFDLAQVCCQLF